MLVDFIETGDDASQTGAGLLRSDATPCVTQLPPGGNFLLHLLLNGM